MSISVSNGGRRARPETIRSQLEFVVGRRRGKLVALVLLSLVVVVLEAIALALTALIAAALIKGERHLGIHGIRIKAPLLTLIAVAGGLSLLRIALQFPLAIMPSQIGSQIQAELRMKLFDAFMRASWSEQARDREGQLQETMTSQVMQASAASFQATALITSVLNFAILLAIAFVVNSIAAVAVMLMTFAILMLLRPLRRLGIRNARRLSGSQVRYAGAVAESIRVAQETRVFGVAAAQTSMIGEFVERARRLALRNNMTLKLMAYLYQSVLNLMLVGGLAVLYYAGRGQAGSLGAVVLLLIRASSNGQQVAAGFQALSQSLPYIERVQDTVRRYADSAPVMGSRPLSDVHTLALEGVSYAYRRGRPVLSDITFEIDAREAVGIIGPSGAGKSTLIQILLQLRTPDEGRYLINGEPAAEHLASDWHRLVSYVPQEPRLLHATVAENIRYLRPLGDEAVERAARLALIHDDVMGWPNGYDTMVGPRADAVSGGQQQRICLARALAARPGLLILDEPTSALDPNSETLIQESLSALSNELTLFIIAHRMSTLDICDRVMVIVDGRLAAFGTKTELQRTNHYYRSASLIAAGGSRLT
jgi:ABC-type multidrug transport system fused ATPase/permease subunit